MACKGQTKTEAFCLGWQLTLDSGWTDSACRSMGGFSWPCDFLSQQELKSRDLKLMNCAWLESSKNIWLVKSGWAGIFWDGEGRRRNSVLLCSEQMLTPFGTNNYLYWQPQQIHYGWSYKWVAALYGCWRGEEWKWVYGCRESWDAAANIFTEHQELHKCFLFFLEKIFWFLDVSCLFLDKERNLLS